MLKNLMSKNLNILTYFTSGLSVLSLILTIEDKKFKDKYLKLQESKDLLEKQINDLKIDELKNEVIKNKVETFRTSLEDSQNKILTEVEKIQNLEVKTQDQKEILNNHLNNFNTETENMQNIIYDVLKYFHDDKNKFIGDNINLFDFLSNFINNWNNLLSNLNFEQLIAVAHLTSSICILINILNILSILFGDKLINYFKIEEKFPKISLLFKLRTKVNKFSLTISFVMIISILLALIYANILILTM